MQGGLTLFNRRLHYAVLTWCLCSWIVVIDSVIIIFDWMRRVCRQCRHISNVICMWMGVCVCGGRDGHTEWVISRQFRWHSSCSDISLKRHTSFIWSMTRTPNIAHSGTRISTQISPWGAAKSPSEPGAEEISLISKIPLKICNVCVHWLPVDLYNLLQCRAAVREDIYNCARFIREGDTYKFDTAPHPPHSECTTDADQWLKILKNCWNFRRICICARVGVYEVRNCSAHSLIHSERAEGLCPRSPSSSDFHLDLVGHGEKRWTKSSGYHPQYTSFRGPSS